MGTAKERVDVETTKRVVGRSWKNLKAYLLYRRHLFAYTLLLVAVSFGAVPLGLGGALYLATAGVLGAGFLWIAARGLGSTVDVGWARTAFAYSLLYLPALITVLVIDAI